MCRSSASTHYDRIVFLSRGGQTFPVRGQIVNILDLAIHVVCVVTTQALLLQCENSYRQYVNEWVCLCADKTLFTKPGSGLDLAHGTGLSTPALTH